MAAALITDALWDRHARNWTCLQETRHRPLRRALLGALGPLTGVRLLDVGCGVGLLLREAAERGAWVAGVDTADELLEVARWALPDADLAVAAPEELPHDNGRFDVATACNTLCYAADPRTAAAELARVVRPGGRVAAGDWVDPPGSRTRDFTDRLGVVPEVPVFGELVRVDGSELDFPVTYPDLATAWSAVLARAGVRAAVEAIGTIEAHELFLDVFAQAQRQDGTVRDHNVFAWTLATKPV